MLDSALMLLTHPMAILLIGLLTVVGMILVLRVNAFLALITAAIFVSLLAPGQLADKINRVAVAFGGAAGKIGIVIALAAIIGKCMMDSGAADRIVRSFVRLLGAKRAPEALVGSGFVLSIPVFFDTVFYLTVPLARSLYRQTKRDYLLYVLAIGAGAVVTHVMVPPTPGPLLIAATLNIDLGVMILMGVALGIPTSIVGLLAARWLNRHMEVPMRPYPGEQETKPLRDDELPRLWLALLPIVLPVLLISANTVTKVLAETEHRAMVEDGSLLRWDALAATLRDGASPDTVEPVQRLYELLPTAMKQKLQDPAAADDPEVQAELQEAVRAVARQHSLAGQPAMVGIGLNDAARKELEAAVRRLPKDAQDRFNKLYRAKVLAGTATTPRARQAIDEVMANLSAEERERFNWLVLESVFPKHVRETRWRSVDAVTDLLGNANFALLISAVLSMGILVRQRKMGFGQLAQVTEEALMSAGVIILITAAGGAFGAMLAEARIGDLIQQMASSEGSGMGMTLMWIAFGTALVIKSAQGSSTVAMITTSGMVQAMGVSPEALGFHPVYLAIAIASGSLCFSWMNDSGFWVVARMTGMKETEALKSWTVLVGIIGMAGMGFAALAAWLVPLV